MCAARLSLSCCLNWLVLLCLSNDFADYINNYHLPFIWWYYLFYFWNVYNWSIFDASVEKNYSQVCLNYKAYYSNWNEDQCKGSLITILMNMWPCDTSDILVNLLGYTWMCIMSEPWHDKLGTGHSVHKGF